MSIRQGDKILAGNPNMDIIQEQYNAFVGEVEKKIAALDGRVEEMETQLEDVNTLLDTINGEVI